MWTTDLMCDVAKINAVSVLPIGPFDTAFTYLINCEYDIGDVVRIPFGQRYIPGVVIDEPIGNVKNLDLKSIELKYNFKLHNVSLSFINWVARYSMYNRGKILKMVLAEPSLFKKKAIADILQDIEYHLNEIVLSPEQQEAYALIVEHQNKPVVLHGVTGAGKTEVYLKLVQDVLKERKQALILFPEIALTQQMINRIERYFGAPPLIWNSSCSPKMRKYILKYVNSGYPCVVIGSRSALFLPFANLAIIVVDEEHDASYKQEEGVLYNARDMAVVRAKLGDIPIILSSATPSLETYANAQNGKYNHVQLSHRFGPSNMPYVDVIDLKKEKTKSLISEPLRQQIAKALQSNEQVMLYVNRRGYAPITVCKECGVKIECPNCSALMVNYKSKSHLMCNYCGFFYDIPTTCTKCNAENSLVTYGAGVEKVLEEVTQLFPQATSIIASSDTMSTLKNATEVINNIKAHNVDIIIATQILSKGHHFSDLTLVGVVDGDFGLDMADIRASEKTFQLLNQVAGRAGREAKQGRILIQTFDPKNIVFDMIQNNAINAFLNYEMNNRRDYALPPFCKMIAIIVSGNNAILVENTAKTLAQNRIQDVIILGPIPAPMLKLKGRTRWRILLKSAKNVDIQSKTRLWLSKFKCIRSVSIQIDVDPLCFM